MTETNFGVTWRMIVMDSDYESHGTGRPVRGSDATPSAGGLNPNRPEGPGPDTESVLRGCRFLGRGL